MNEAFTDPVPKKRRRFKPQEKMEWLTRFRAAGTSQADFCQQEGLAQSTLQRWLVQERDGLLKDSPAKAAPVFQEIALPSASASGPWVAELCRANGSVLRLAAGLELKWLEELWRAC